MVYSQVLNRTSEVSQMGRTKAESKIDRAIHTLGEQWDLLAWEFREVDMGGRRELVSQWQGDPADDIMVVVFEGNRVLEPYHRQDFFFIDYAYKGSYEALSADECNQVTVREGDCYVGQPHSGYALRGDEPDGIVMVGIHIKREAFFREYLPALSANPDMLGFFLRPHADSFSEDFVHVSLADVPLARELFEMMVVEYAAKDFDTQSVLKPLALALLVQVSRMQRALSTGPVPRTTAERAAQAIAARPESVTLDALARQLSYHPNYLSGLLRKETGKTFSQLVLEARMERASAILRGSDLTVEEVGAMVGYADPGNFHKAFRKYWGSTPGEHRRADR